MPVSMLAAAFVAAIVGYGSTIALVLAAAAAVSATPEQTASWVAGVCFAKAIGSAVLSVWTRVPVLLAWSTPGAAIIAGTTNVSMPEAVGAFVVAGLLIVATAAIPVLARAVSNIPSGIAAAMLAGVLLPFCMSVATAAVASPIDVAPVIAAFLLVRLVNPLWGVIAALVVGVGWVGWRTGLSVPADVGLGAPLVFIAPEWTPSVMLGLGVPLYLVTMASQNLPGFAVLKAHGYDPPTARALGVSGLLSAVTAFAGAHTINMAAITAAICLSPDTHPDAAKRWRIGLVYAAIWVVLGLVGSALIAAITSLPAALIAALAGIALLTPLMGALAGAFEAPEQRFPAAVTLAVSASGVAAFGIGAAFWGLAAGLLVWSLDHLSRRPSARKDASRTEPSRQTPSGARQATD
ncbi:MAG: benzoate/H(+) symporter BenE family transporter [Pseudomonadota bacterium]